MAGKTAYKNQYNLDNYDRINLTLKKGMKEQVKLRAAQAGMSVNRYICELILNDLDKGQSAVNKSEKKDLAVYLY